MTEDYYLTLAAVAPDVHGHAARLQGRCHFFRPLRAAHVCHWKSINGHNLIVGAQPAKLRWTAWGRTDRCQGNEDR